MKVLHCRLISFQQTTRKHGGDPGEEGACWSGNKRCSGGQRKSGKSGFLEHGTKQLTKEKDCRVINEEKIGTDDCGTTSCGNGITNTNSR